MDARRRLCFFALGLLLAQPVAAAGAKPPVNVTMGFAIEKLAAKIRDLQTDDRDIASEEARRVKHARNAVCAFSVLQAVNFLARSAFQIKVMTEFCPEAEAIPLGQPGYKTPMKTCLISTASLITSMSQIAAGLALAADACQDTVNIDALCAAPIAALLTPTTQFIAASTVASAACAKEVSELPKEIEFDRRLQGERRLQASPPKPPSWAISPEKRRWQIGECVIDATSAVMAMGQMALGFNAATRSCPFVRGQPLQEEVSKAACTVDTAFTFFSFSRLVLFIALAVEHCAPGDQTDSLCVAACTGLTASAFAVTFQGAAIYLNCQIGTDKNAIIAGTSVQLDQSQNKKRNQKKGRRLGQEELVDTLHKAAGFDRRLSRGELIEELAKESEFETAEELWLSMGYNLSDHNAPWLKDDEDGLEVIRKGRQMLKDLQTERAEPAKELFEYGPEEVLPRDVPEVLVDPENDAAAVNCSQKGVAYSLDLPGHAVSLEQGVAACQARCAKTPGCARFSYWPPDRHCRLHGVLADPVPGQPLWISGPPGCTDAQISKATLRTMKRKLDCYHPHAIYEPRDALAPPQPAASIEDCQRRCQRMAGCAHFVFSELDGTCSFAEKSAVKLQPVLYNIAGPRHCQDAAVALSSQGESAKFEDANGPVAISSAGPAKILTAALGAVAGAALLFWAGVAASRRMYRSVAQKEPVIE